jgi:hypothetical protein
MPVISMQSIKNDHYPIDWLRMRDFRTLTSTLCTVPAMFQVALVFWLNTVPVLVSSAQQINYDVYLNEKQVGYLLAKRSSKDDLTNYWIESNVNFRFVFKMNFNYTFETVFQNDMLIRASTLNTVNEDEKGSSKVTWNGKFYQMEVKNERSELKNTRITYSMSMLYFREPRQISQVFSERYARFLAIRAVKEHSYELTMPDGKKNIYSYVNGICQAVEVQHSVGKISFRLKNQK